MRLQWIGVSKPTGIEIDHVFSSDSNPRMSA